MEQLETYQPLSWAHMVHGLPHLNLHLQAVGSAFLPRDWEYQQALIFLAGLVMLTLAINLTFLLIYLLHLCYCSPGGRDESQMRDPKRRTSQSVAAVLLCCTGIAVGFYGNNEVSEGIYQAAFSLRKVNHTLVAMETLVQNTTEMLSWAITSDLTRLEEIFSDSAHFLVVTRNSRRQTEALLSHLGRMAFWRGLKPQLLELEQWARHTEGYRNLLFLLLLILDLVICLLVLLGLARKGSWLLIGVTVLSVVGLVVGWISLGVESVSVQALSDFCVDPHSFILNITASELGIREGLLSYYLTCDDVDYNPFHEPLVLCQRTMSALNSQMHSLQREAIAEFPAARIHLEVTQTIFNRTEQVVSHLTVLLHCWWIHTLYEDVLRGVCYKALGGSLYLSLFSVLTVTAFCCLVCVLPQVQLYTQRLRTPGRCDLEEDDGEEVGHFASQAPRRPHQVRDWVPALCPYPRHRARPSGVRASAPPISLAQLPHYA